MIDDPLLILQKYFGYDNFRGVQREIIESITSGHDTLGLMPTGGGKSITFQVPAIAMPGVCLVITPLIALMKDQVAIFKARIAALHKRGVYAEAIYSGMKKSQMYTILDNCIFGRVRLLYVSPERLLSSEFTDKLRHMPVSFICVDEAHCICQWGYDFRPAYLKIAEIRKFFPDVPVLALTATATPDVQADICKHLSLGEPQFNVFTMSFERKNISYILRETPNKDDEILKILKSTEPSTSIIIYVTTRSHAEKLAVYLNKSDVNATFYHAGLSPEERDVRQQAWTLGNIPIMVATNAFGMGINKADVRYVIHRDVPDSIEAYYQEAGRAGRDGLPSYAVMLWDEGDISILKRHVSENYPTLDYIRRLYDDLAYFLQVAENERKSAVFNLERFCTVFHHWPLTVEGALGLLTAAGYLKYDPDHETSPRVKFTLTREDLYCLSNLPDDEERVIEALLRCYGSLFSELTSIDISLVAMSANLSERHVIETLHNLYAQRLLTFIPERNRPTIQYLRPREEGSSITLPYNVYDVRLKAAEGRIEALTTFIRNPHHECRNVMLRRYFGEPNPQPCGTCDVCREKCKRNNHEAKGKDKNPILEFLSDGQWHPIRQLSSIPLSMPEIEALLRHLTEEEKVKVKDGMICLC